MENRITKALTKLFDRHRIVFWYDTKHELRGDFDALSLSGVEKLELTKNEFGIKYRMLREQPKQKFLLYHEGPQPADIDNWLLDVQLAHGEFRTDQVAIWLSEMELSIEFIELVQSHAEFFQAIKRRESLKTAIRPDDTAGAIRLKMLAVCSNSDARIDAVIESLLQDHAEDREEKFKLIQRSGLESFLWDQLLRHYGYKSDTPGVQDFVIELFKSCYAMGTDGEFKLTTDALVFLKRWKDNRKYTTESYRVYRRLTFLRELANEQTTWIFTRSTGTSGSPGINQ